MMTWQCVLSFMPGWFTRLITSKNLLTKMFVKRLYEEQKNQIEQDMAPFGFLSDGLDDDVEVDADGDTWFKADEYGDRSYMWEYR